MPSIPARRLPASEASTHLDGAHRVTADAGGQHLCEEHALEVGGAQAAPAEQRPRSGTGRRIRGAEQDTPFDDARGDREHGESESGGDPERIGVRQARNGLRQVDRVGKDGQTDDRSADARPWRTDHGAGDLHGSSHRPH
jgi:hypothetical protein